MFRLKKIENGVYGFHFSMTLKNKDCALSVNVVDS